MNKRLIVHNYLAIALLLYPLSVAATTGVPSGLVILPLALFFPFLAVFLLMEVILRRKAKPTKWGTNKWGHE